MAGEGFLESLIQTDAFPIDNVTSQPLVHGKIGQRRAGGPGLAGGHPLEQGGEFGERVIDAQSSLTLLLEATAVVDEVPPEVCEPDASELVVSPVLASDVPVSDPVSVEDVGSRVSPSASDASSGATSS